ncbi:hypothetical protein V512_000260 [Mesotoga sp. Brook.08.105.5.1]|uniref:hypothetical protein n=1 Tax=Mesotoga sp. Brook.08.105.5.1 TaxID=1421002 RepID=UPI000C199049|nr:hypothetical protein [Mesotoga sp. Brook.08.105.5.1]PVD15381.1 hypothetical protein V512_000260 [Mesotoga sp. Brook.08.105.5.1]
MSERFKVRIEDLQPSQLYISKEKLRAIRKKETLKSVPVPVIDLDGKFVMADGHTRAIAAIIEGYDSIFIEITDEKLDLEEYKECVKWCVEEGVFTPYDLVERIINHDDYEVLWYERCERLHEELKLKRSSM